MTHEQNNEVAAQTGSEDVAVSELLAVLSQRSATYTLLSRLYRQEIDQALLDELHGMLYPAKTGDDNLDTGYLFIATFLSNLWSGSLQDLKIDFARCFLGHGVDSYSAAYPYESVYTSPKRLMMQHARDEVLALYRAQGIEKTPDWKEGEDSLALELQFERILGDRTIEALLAGDQAKAEALLQAQFDFQRDHLISWVPLLVRDMKRFAETKLYLGLAYLTEGFLQTDYQFLKDLVFEHEGA
ncbi:MAG: molecular chaperone TorD family protein [Coriobacteriales bacterium]|nr:molecular chaperone TorD family protein [Coriobacteriales bacterium]